MSVFHFRCLNASCTISTLAPLWYLTAMWSHCSCWQTSTMWNLCMRSVSRWSLLASRSTWWLRAAPASRDLPLFQDPPPPRGPPPPMSPSPAAPVSPSPVTRTPVMTSVGVWACWLRIPLGLVPCLHCAPEWAPPPRVVSPWPTWRPVRPSPCHWSWRCWCTVRTSRSPRLLSTIWRPAWLNISSTTTLGSGMTLS